LHGPCRQQIQAIPVHFVAGDHDRQTKSPHCGRVARCMRRMAFSRGTRGQHADVRDAQSCPAPQALTMAGNVNARSVRSALATEKLSGQSFGPNLVAESAQLRRRQGAAQLASGIAFAAQPLGTRRTGQSRIQPTLSRLSHGRGLSISESSRAPSFDMHRRSLRLAGSVHWSGARKLPSAPAPQIRLASKASKPETRERVAPTP
jgi:hypothetical protein